MPRRVMMIGFSHATLRTTSDRRRELEREATMARAAKAAHASRAIASTTARTERDDALKIRALFAHRRNATAS